MDQFLLNYSAVELKTASEFLTNWLPFLSAGLCNSCTRVLSDRIRSLDMEKKFTDSNPVIIERNKYNEAGGNWSSIQSTTDSADNNDNVDTYSLGSWKDEADGSCEHVVEASPIESFGSSAIFATPQMKKSWADMALEDELAEEEEIEFNHNLFINVNDSIEDGMPLDEHKPKVALTRDQREYIRFCNMGRKKDFAYLERINGKFVNIVSGLELHTSVFSAAEQKRIVNYVEELHEMGKNGRLRERTYTAPSKWMRGKGRITLQFGCCYNYATDKKGNPPGIMKNELVDPLPHLFKVMIKRLVRWHVLPPSCVPDSCIVNIYDEGDCIPPHIDNHDFLRPFCTVSFLSECDILFGSNLKIVGPGEFAGSFAIPLPVGSVLVLNGNGADVAKHCVPAVHTKRISITFRKMDESKWPEKYTPEPDLQGLQPLPDEADNLKRNNYNNGSGSGPRRSPRMPNSVGRVDRGRGYTSTPRYSDNNAPRHSDNRFSGRGRHATNNKGRFQANLEN